MFTEIHYKFAYLIHKSQKFNIEIKIKANANYNLSN